MSSTVSGICGGQPSTTQPIATPWLSPKVVTRNRWPKVLWDMVCRNAQTPLGQIVKRFDSPLTILRQPFIAEHINRAMLDREISGTFGGLKAERDHQRPRGAAMGDRDRVARQAPIPVRYPGLHLHVTLAARRRHGPLLDLAPREQIGVLRLHLSQRRAFPLAVGDFTQAIVDGVGGKRELQGAAHQFHALPGATKRACNKRDRGRALPVAQKEFGEDAAGVDRLPAAEVVERDVLHALEPALRIPLCLAVTDVIDSRRGHRGLRSSLLRELLREISGACGRFMPTTW